jgi:two-component system sensor histidine kinase BaeS
MTDYVRHHLGAKLLLSYICIALVGAAVLVFTSEIVLPNSFNRHMLGMGMGQMMGAGRQGTGGYGTIAQLYVDYRAGFNEALAFAVLAAILVAVLLSLFFSRSVIAPLRAMATSSQRIADGHYDERVHVRGVDELAQLAERFNRMAAKLEQVESMRRRLIGDVSHELRTPLTAIKGSMEGLMDGILPAEAATYEQIHAEAERLNRLVDDLQELSRVEAGAYELELRPVDVSSMAQTVMKRLGRQFESRHISLALELEPDLPRVLADEDRTLQVLTNLAGNALQYTSDGGNVMISAKRSNGEVQISVRDTGIGIGPEHLEHIFDRFYRVDKSRSRLAGGGSGIGLTIARALIEAQAGRIWVESQGEARGTTFTFTLPVAK